MKKKKEKTQSKELIKNQKSKSSLGARNKRRGNAYETKIAKELRELGFEKVVTSRSESKNTDDNKVDLIDTDDKLPCNIQLKKTMSTPQYFSIRKESTVSPESFVLIWNKQKRVNDRFMSEGEVVMMDKRFFYELIKPYA